MYTTHIYRYCIIQRLTGTKEIKVAVIAGKITESWSYENALGGDTPTKCALSTQEKQLVTDCIEKYRSLPGGNWADVALRIDIMFYNNMPYLNEIEGECASGIGGTSQRAGLSTALCEWLKGCVNYYLQRAGIDAIFILCTYILNYFPLIIYCLFFASTSVSASASSSSTISFYFSFSFSSSCSLQLQ